MALYGSFVGKDELETQVIGIFESELRSLILDSWDEWSLGGRKPDHLSFILRFSAWLGEEGKIVFYVFGQGERQPVLIGKTVHNPRFGDAVKKEAHALFSIWEQVSKVMPEAVPRPVALREIAGVPVYLEEAVPGTSLPERVMRRWRKKKQYRVLAKAVSEAAEWLWDFENCMGIVDLKLTSEEIQDWFIAPIEVFKERVVLDKNERTVIKELEEAFWKWEGCFIPVVAGHGDFWGGSLIWSDSGLGVIDWEFFQSQSLPLFDLFMLAVHPGVAIGKSGWELLDEFSMCFEDSLFTRQVRVILSTFSRRLGLSAEIIRSLFRLFLIYLANSRDRTIDKGKCHRSKTWRSLFEYYVRHKDQLCILP